MVSNARPNPISGNLLLKPDSLYEVVADGYAT